MSSWHHKENKCTSTKGRRLPSPLNHNIVERVASDGRRSAPLLAATGPGTAAAVACNVEMVEAISARCPALLTLVVRVEFEPLSVSALRGRRFRNPKRRDKLGMQPFGAGVVSADSIFNRSQNEMLAG